LRKLATYAGFTIIVLAALTGLGIAAASIFGGIKVMAILSGSMQPAWARGELLFLQAEPARLVHVGQAIAYHPPANIFNAIVVHQVIAVHHLSNGVVAQTKGLANKVKDPWVDYLSGPVYRVAFKLPYLGLLTIWMSYWRLDAIFGAAIIAAIVVSLVLHYIKETDEKDGSQDASIAVSSRA
jgi:signal peptidase